MRTPKLLSVLLALAVPAAAAANGGPSRWVSAEMDGATLPGDGGRHEAVQLVRDEDVECTSEDLSITLGEDVVSVKVEYVLVNRGPTKSIDYAFPYAVAEQKVVAGGKVRERALGAPGKYSLSVNGKRVPAKRQPGLEVPADLPVPAIDDNRDVPDFGEWSAPRDGRGEFEGGTIRVENRYRFQYWVSRLELPAGEPVRLTVSYSSGYLVYRKVGEGGAAESPPSFSYLLSTGDRWRGGKIGKLKIRVRGTDETLPRYGIDGLPLTRTGDVATYAARDVVPTADMNLVIRRSDFAALPVQVVPGKESGSFELTPGRSHTSYDQRQLRFRLGVLPPAGVQQPARVLVVLVLSDGTRDAFQATFGPATPDQIEANGGRRHVYFDAGDVPRKVQLTFLGVDPASAEKLRTTRFVLEQDVTNYEAWVPLPR